MLKKFLFFAKGIFDGIFRVYFLPNVQNEVGGGVKGFWNSVKKNCSIGTTGHPLAVLSKKVF